MITRELCAALCLAPFGALWVLAGLAALALLRLGARR